MTEGEKALLKCGFEYDSSEYDEQKNITIWYKCENIFMEFSISSYSTHWTANTYYEDDDLPVHLNLEDIKAIALRLEELNNGVMKLD